VIKEYKQKLTQTLSSNICSPLIVLKKGANMKRLIGILVIIFIIALLPACGGSSEEEAVGTNNDQEEVSIEQDSDEMTITGEGSETTVTKDLNKSVELPEGYPEDVIPIYDDLFLITAMKRDDGSFAVSGGSKDSIQNVGDFYENVLEDAKVVMKDFVEDAYSNIGEFKGYTYTITISESEGEMVDRFESFVMIIIVPGDLSGMTTEEETVEEEAVGEGNENYAGGIVVPDDLILPADYPKEEMPFYGKGEENVLAAVEEKNGQQMVGYMTTDPLEKVYEYFKEKYSDADQFMVMNDTDTDKNIMISMNGKVFQVTLFQNNEMTGEDLKYKTLISIMY